ncbi:MAG: efflux RND transporter periplasmic adaptor subunit [Prolixibacteraceae bacterium]
MKFQTIFSLFILLCLGSSCRQKPNESIFVDLYPATYIDELTVDGTVEAVNSTSVNSPARLEGTVVFLVENGIQVKKGDTVCIMENREYDNIYENILTNIEKTQTSYNKSKADLDMNYALLKAQLSNIEAQTSITNLDSVQLNYITPVQRQVKELELQIAGIEKRKFERKLEFLKRINESELKKLQLQIKRDKNQAKFIMDILSEMVMIAPQKGMALRATSQLNDDNKVQEGDQVWPGVPIVTIPDLSQMKVTILASETDYKRIGVNDSVWYTFDAMPGNRAWGKIQQISPMGRPIQRRSKIKVFEITASIDSFIVIPDPGLSANCRIILQEIPDTVVVPQLAIFEEDSIKVVYVREGRHFSRQEIVVGASSLKEAVVIAGLKGTETLTYVKPSESKINHEYFISDTIKTKLNLLKSDTIPVVEPSVPNDAPIGETEMSDLN